MLLAIIRALRIHQWSKNLLLLVPALMAHTLQKPEVFSPLCYALFSFCLCASAVYLLNDILDRKTDREHPQKRTRPIASGDLSVKIAAVFLLLFLALSAALAAELPQRFTALLLGYFLLTTAYSLWLKRVVVIDILVLALLYSLRIFAGGEAVTVEVSPWLMGFSMFLFLSLAALKRYAELLAHEGSHGRGYLKEDSGLISQLGTASGYCAVLVLALYINSESVTLLYNRPRLLWMLCPILVYWITRVWLLASRGQMQEDPVVFALKDIPSYFAGMLALGVLYLAV